MPLTRVSLSMIGYGGPTTISTDTTITGDVFVGEGQLITVAPGKTLTFSGFFTAGPYPIFTAGSQVIFNEGVTTEVFPDWWDGEFGAAVSSAFASLKATGGKIVFTKSHDCTTPINCTGSHTGMIFEGRGGAFSDNAVGVTIAFAHTGVGMDCSDSEHFIFRDLKFKGGPLAQIPVTTVPKYGLLFARSLAGSGCGKHTFYNVMFNNPSSFSSACLYNFGAEEMFFYQCTFYNSVTTGKLVVITSNNIQAATSPFITLAATNSAQSTSVHHFMDGEYLQAGGGTSDCFYLEGCAEMIFDGGLYLNANGRSLFYVDNTIQATSIGQIRGIRDEGQGGASYGIYFTGTFNPYGWTVFGNHFQLKSSTSWAVYVADGVNLNTLTYFNNVDASSQGISAKNLTLCNLNLHDNAFNGRVGGDIVSCDITGNSGTVIFAGSTTLTNLRDLQYNALRLVGNTGVSLPPVYIINTTGSSTTTVVTGMPYIKAGAFVFLTPASATAVALMTSIYVSSIQVGVGFTLTHASTTSGLFNFMVINGT